MSQMRAAVKMEKVVWRLIKKIQLRDNQAIPGNDQNASPTNQKTAKSKLDWIS